MKNLVLGFGTIVMSILTIMTIAALNINSINQLDLITATRMAAYQTLDQRYDDESVPIIRIKNDDGTYKSPEDNEFKNKTWTDLSGNSHTGWEQYKDDSGKVSGYYISYKTTNAKGKLEIVNYYSDAQKQYVYEDYKIKDDETMQKMFNENLSMLLKKQGVVQVRVLGMDYAEGIVSVNVSYTYENFGAKRTISTTQTVIRENSAVATIVEEPEKATNYIYAMLYTDGELVISSNPITATKTIAEDYNKVNIDGYTPPWSYSSAIKTVTFKGAVKPVDCMSWFLECNNLTKINNLENLYTSECEDMTSMFEGCSKLTDLDLSGFETEKVDSMESMFKNCSSLQKLDLSGFDTTKVNNMDEMFNGCTSLTLLDISNFDTKEVNSMKKMFYNCGNTRDAMKLDLGNSFICQDVLNMSSMFEHSFIISLDMSKWETGKVTNMNKMFANATMASLTLGNINLDKVADISDMFVDADGILSISSSQTVKNKLYNTTTKATTVIQNQDWTVD